MGGLWLERYQTFCISEDCLFLIVVALHIGPKPCHSARFSALDTTKGDNLSKVWSVLMLSTMTNICQESGKVSESDSESSWRSLFKLCSEERASPLEEKSAVAAPQNSLLMLPIRRGDQQGDVVGISPAKNTRDTRVIYSDKQQS